MIKSGCHRNQNPGEGHTVADRGGVEKGMKQTEIIAHLRDLRESQAEFAKTNVDEPIKVKCREWQMQIETSRNIS